MTGTVPLYRATRSGHFPPDLRDAFLAAVDAFENWDSAVPEPMVEVRHRQLTITAVSDLLRGCHDLLPALTCDVLGIERASTYEMGAERLKALASQGGRP